LTSNQSSVIWDCPYL